MSIWHFLEDIQLYNCKEGAIRANVLTALQIWDFFYLHVFHCSAFFNCYVSSLDGTSKFAILCLFHHFNEPNSRHLQAQMLSVSGSTHCHCVSLQNLALLVSMMPPIVLSGSHWQCEHLATQKGPSGGGRFQANNCSRWSHGHLLLLFMWRAWLASRVLTQFRVLFPSSLGSKGLRCVEISFYSLRAFPGCDIRMVRET